MLRFISPTTETSGLKSGSARHDRADFCQHWRELLLIGRLPESRILPARIFDL